MKIWKKYYNVQISEINTVQYNKLLKDGKQYYENSQDFKNTLEYIITAYIFLIEGFNKVVTAQEFAELIKKYYSMDNLKNRFAYEFMMNC